MEKETRVRESMLMMGLKQPVLWATWFIKQLLFLLFPIIVITFIVKVSISLSKVLARNVL